MVYGPERYVIGYEIEWLLKLDLGFRRANFAAKATDGQDPTADCGDSLGENWHAMAKTLTASSGPVQPNGGEAPPRIWSCRACIKP